MKKIILLSMMTMALLAGCKKDKPENEVSLKGKWIVESTTIKEYLNGRLEDTFTEPGDGTTIDFQENGQAVLTVPGAGVESLPYTIKPDSKLEMDGDLYEIRELTRTTVKLFTRYDYATGEYDEVLISLKR